MTSAESSGELVGEAARAAARELSSIVATHRDGKVAELAGSQAALGERLDLLQGEMRRLSGAVEALSADPGTGAKIEEARRTLTAIRRTLTGISARLRRLRGYEERERLQHVRVEKMQQQR